MTTRKADRRHGGADPALWRRDADVVVVGSGAAGISAALTAAAGGLRVLVVTKDLVGGATPLAQGGLAAALGPGDTPAAHAADTLVAGAGLCSPDTVTPLAQSAPGAIGWLTGLGARCHLAKSDASPLGRAYVKVVALQRLAESAAVQYRHEVAATDEDAQRLLREAGVGTD